MEINFKHTTKHTKKEIVVKVSTHNHYIDCETNDNSPFGHGERVLPPEINPKDYKQIVIRCFIDENERLKTSHSISGESGDSVCHSTVEQFVNEHYFGKKLMQIGTRSCNHYEHQYKYIMLTT